MPIKLKYRAGPRLTTAGGTTSDWLLRENKRKRGVEGGAFQTNGEGGWLRFLLGPLFLALSIASLLLMLLCGLLGNKVSQRGVFFFFFFFFTVIRMMRDLRGEGRGQ